MLFEYEEIKNINLKDKILSEVSQEDIFARYLSIEVKAKSMFRNPLRDDKNPTCEFVKFNGVLYLRDYSGFFGEIGIDCFDLVSFLYNLSFKEALLRIKEDLNIGKIGLFSVASKRKEIEIEESEPKKISIVKRIFNNVDKEFWNQGTIQEEDLIKFNVYPVKECWIDELRGYWYSEKYADNVAYSYFFEDGSTKVYFPNKDKRYRFIGNSNYVQGLRELDFSKDMVFITKSMKDVISLYKLGYTAISEQSEGSIVRDWLIKLLKVAFKEVILLYDNDEAGIEGAKRNSKKHSIPYVYYDESSSKDTFDNIKDYGADATKQKIINLLKQKRNENN
jgi:hypothetical protein